MIVIQDGMDNGELCRADNGGDGEDVELGRCSSNLGVEAGDSRDSQGRQRFMPYTAHHHLIPGAIPQDSWYWSFQYYEEEEGLAACSDSAVRKGSTMTPKHQRKAFHNNL